MSTEHLSVPQLIENRSGKINRALQKIEAHLPTIGTPFGLDKYNAKLEGLESDERVMRAFESGRARKRISEHILPTLQNHLQENNETKEKLDEVVQNDKDIVEANSLLKEGYLSPEEYDIIVQEKTTGFLKLVHPNVASKFKYQQKAEEIHVEHQVEMPTEQIVPAVDLPVMVDAESPKLEPEADVLKQEHEVMAILQKISMVRGERFTNSHGVHFIKEILRGRRNGEFFNAEYYTSMLIGELTMNNKKHFSVVLTQINRAIKDAGLRVVSKPGENKRVVYDIAFISTEEIEAEEKQKADIENTETEHKRPKFFTCEEALFLATFFQNNIGGIGRSENPHLKVIRDKYNADTVLGLISEFVQYFEDRKSPLDLSQVDNEEAPYMRAKTLESIWRKISHILFIDPINPDANEEEIERQQKEIAEKQEITDSLDEDAHLFISYVSDLLNAQPKFDDDTLGRRHIFEKIAEAFWMQSTIKYSIDGRKLDVSGAETVFEPISRSGEFIGKKQVKFSRPKRRQ